MGWAINGREARRNEAEHRSNQASVLFSVRRNNIVYGCYYFGHIWNDATTICFDCRHLIDSLLIDRVIGFDTNFWKATFSVRG